jgi:hypothetical protein
MIRDPESCETYTYNRCKGETVIPLSQASNPACIERAKYADALSAAATNKPLIVSKSAHDYLEAINAHPDLPIVTEGAFRRLCST